MSDPTDPGGVGAHAERGRTSTRVGDSGSPVGSPLTIVLALIAVVVGFLIFRSIDDSDAGGLEPVDGPTTVPTAPGGSTTAPGGQTATTTGAGPTTTAPPTRDGATVVVINAAEVDGAAGRMSDQLEALGYTMAEAISDNNEEQDQTTTVYFQAGNNTEAVARTVAKDLGGAEVEPAPSPLPTNDSTGAASVFVFLGADVVDEEIPIAGNPAAPAAGGGQTTTG
jgi:hypothetical protein